MEGEVRHGVEFCPIPPIVPAGVVLGYVLASQRLWQSSYVTQVFAVPLGGHTVGVGDQLAVCHVLALLVHRV